MADDPWKRLPNGAIDCGLLASSEVARGRDIVALQLVTRAPADRKTGELVQVAMAPEHAISIGQALLDAGREAAAVRDGKSN